MNHEDDRTLNRAVVSFNRTGDWPTGVANALWHPRAYQFLNERLQQRHADLPQAESSNGEKQHGENHTEKRAERHVEKRADRRAETSCARDHKLALSTELQAAAFGPEARRRPPVPIHDPVKPW